MASPELGVPGLSGRDVEGLEEVLIVQAGAEARSDGRGVVVVEVGRRLHFAISFSRRTLPLRRSPPGRHSEE